MDVSTVEARNMTVIVYYNVVLFVRPSVGNAMLSHVLGRDTHIRVWMVYSEQ